jgi:Ca-activated chloride channel family protein
MASLALSVDTDQRMVATEVSSQRTIEWHIRATDLAQASVRAPLNLALIIDRSGSMQGDKLRYVQQAACHVLDLLDERDQIAIVAYDDTIQLVSPAAHVTVAARADLKARVQALFPGGWTDLSGGWLEGCRAIAQNQVAGHVHRALLLTDGLANRGITDIEELTHHARQLRQRGIATSTFGVGLDFNEHLLEALAMQGGGHFFFIDEPSKIVTVFRQELGELLTVVAREAFLEVSQPRGVAIELLGDLPHEQHGEKIRVFLGDMGAREERRIYMRVLTPPDAPGTSVVIEGELCFADQQQHTVRVAASIALSYEHQAQIRMLPINTELMQRASEVELATAATRALRLEREGQRAQAQMLMQQTLAATAPYAPAPSAAHYTELADQVGRGLSEPQRKSAQFSAYRKRHTR